jgi:Fe-S-cluster containining protein
MPYEVDRFEGQREQDGFFWRLKRDNGLCVFFKNGRCTNYENRPLECRLYPHILTYQEGRLSLYLHSGCPQREYAQTPEVPVEVQQLNAGWLAAFENLPS